jgi:predicted PurR-regulated permease PerM
MPLGSTPARLKGVRDLVLANLMVLGIALCFLLVYRFAAVLFSLFTGVALGMAVKPAVEWLRRRGLPRWAGALSIYLALAAVAAGFFVLVVPIILEQLGTLLLHAPAQLERLRGAMRGSASPILRRLAHDLPARLLATPAAAPATLDDVGALLPYAGAIGRSLFTVVAVLLLGFFWTLEGERRVRGLVFFAPLEQRRAVLSFVVEVERKVGAYMRGQMLVCLAIGALAFGAYALIGLPYAFVLGLVYAAGEAIPVLGPIVGTLAAAAVALSVNPTLVLSVVAVAAALQLVENYILVPRVMRRAVGVNPLVTLLAITGFGSVLGVAGAVMAIPMAAIVQMMIDRLLLRRRRSEREIPAGRDRASALRYEAQQVAGDVRHLLRLRDRDWGALPQAERIEDAVESLAADLDHLLERGARGAAGARARGGAASASEAAP